VRRQVWGLHENSLALIAGRLAVTAAAAAGFAEQVNETLDILQPPTQRTAPPRWCTPCAWHSSSPPTARSSPRAATPFGLTSSISSWLEVAGSGSKKPSQEHRTLLVNAAVVIAVGFALL
jgi:hypothetical protein